MNHDIETLLKKIKSVKEARENSKNIANNNKFSTITNICFEFSGAIIVGLVLGIFLDKIFNTKPILMIIFIMLSSIAAFTTLIKMRK